MNWEPSSQVLTPNVRKEDAEKKRRPRPLQTRSHFISQWRGASCTPNKLRCKPRWGLGSEELLWGMQAGRDKEKCHCDLRQLHLTSSQEAIRGNVPAVSRS
jgi:hypothetical protein